jgi:5-methylcytosine-specific restriction protein A
MHPFQFGYEYPRTALLAFVGSRQGQSGVIWGSREPGCLICTTGGRHGRSAGYQDAPSELGWSYFGQGSKGDQDVRNAANARLASERYSVLLFTAREPSQKEVRLSKSYAKFFSFHGEFNVLGYDIFVPESGTRLGDKLLKFDLIRVVDAVESYRSADTSAPSQESIAILRERIASSAKSSSDPKARVATYYNRSSMVRAYALARAAGTCEGCSQPGPFESLDGTRFLEVHHLLRLADHGPDDPENVVALCPNCHRRAHLSKDRELFQRRLLETVREIESCISEAFLPDGDANAT